jgi:hypothetical protein
LIADGKGVFHSESIVSRSTAFWRVRYAFAAFRVRRPAEFPEPRIWGVCMIAGGKGIFPPGIA